MQLYINYKVSSHSEDPVYIVSCVYIQSCVASCYLYVIIIIIICLYACLIAGIRFLQNFTTNISGNLLRARCRLVKSDLFVDCQLVILNAEKNSKVLSPVNIMQSNFSVLLPSSKDKFLVTARAVDIHGDTVDLEKFNISYVITPVVTPTLDYMNPASLSGKQAVGRKE